MFGNQVFESILENFKRNYTANISPELKKYEEERLNCLKTVKKISILIVVVTLVFMLILKMHLWLFLFLTGAFLIVFTRFYYNRNYADRVKAEVFPLVCQNIGDIKFVEKYGGHITQYKNSNVVPPFDNEDIFDSFVGNYKDSSFEILKCELKLEVEYNKKSQNEQMFKGNIIRINTNKILQGTTVLKSIKTGHMVSCDKLKYIDISKILSTEDADVYTDNENEAHNIITPDLCGLLEKLMTSFGAKTISTSFQGQYLFIALGSSPDVFTLPSIKNHVNNFQLYYSVAEKFASLMQLIEYLDN